MTNVEEFAIWVIKEAAKSMSVDAFDILHEAKKLNLVDETSHYSFSGDLQDWCHEEIPNE